MSDYVARIRSSDGEQQALMIHLLGVSDITGKTAEKIALRLVGLLAGLVHDFGKYCALFQAYIRSAGGMLNPDDLDWVDPIGNKGHIDHATAGAQWIWQALAPKNIGSQAELARSITAQMLSLVVASHHSGLIDCLRAEKNKPVQDNYTRRINKDISATHLDEVRQTLEQTDKEIRDRLNALLNDDQLIASVHALRERILHTERNHGGSPTILQFKLGLVTRFLLSCLVEGDHRNSADFEDPKRISIRAEGSPDWGLLIARLEKKLQEFSPEKPIDRIRAEISDACLDASERVRGIYTLTVPTGGGKTLASLRFALHHAHRHGLDRIVYVIPYTSIIDQNAGEVRKIMEPEGVSPDSIVLEHHSNLLPDRMTWRHKLMSENWDTPIIYTTSVQLLEALFGSGTRNVRRMHALARAVLIFDEVQAMPLKCAHMFSNAMNFLVEHAGSSVVLCTATQPLLHEIDQQNGAIRLSPNHELMPDTGQLFARLKRTHVTYLHRNGGWSDEEAAELALETQASHQNVLIIVNTKKMARLIFEQCRKKTSLKIYHLSTSMCPAHRRAVLKEMREHLTNNAPLVCVSTQLIEAGIDISFGAVIRSMAGLDSIAQAAGRCNRHQSQEKPAPVFVIDLPEEKIDSLIDIQQGQISARRVLNEISFSPDGSASDVLTTHTISKYFDYYFFERKSCMNYPIDLDNGCYTENNADANLLDLLSLNNIAFKNFQKENQGAAPTYCLHQAFGTAAQAFKAIDSPTQSVVVPYTSAGEKMIAEFYGEHASYQISNLLREAQQYSVNLFDHEFKRLCDQKALHCSDDGVWTLDSAYYHSDFGVSLTPSGTIPTHVY